MEEQTARNKQAEAWEQVVSSQNMGIPAHSSSVTVSVVGTAAAQQSLILLLSSMIQKPQWESSVQHPTVHRVVDSSSVQSSTE